MIVLQVRRGTPSTIIAKTVVQSCEYCNSPYLMYNETK